MQHSQFYFHRIAMLCALALLLGASAKAGTMAKPHQPDPLLDGGPTDPCAADVDYAAGIDVNGHPVVPADVNNQHVPVPAEIAVPLHAGQQPQRRGHPQMPGQGPYVSLDGQRLDGLVNPKPCR